MMADRSSEGTESGEKPRTSTAAVLASIKEPKLFVLISMKSTAGLTNGADRRNGENFCWKSLKSLGALLPYFMNRVFDLAELFKVRRIVENAAVLQEHHKLPDDLAIRGAGVCPLNPTKGAADARYSAGCVRRDLPALFKP